MGAVMSNSDNRHTEPAGVVLTPEQKRARSRRNIAIGLSLVLLIVLFYVVTIAKLGPGVLGKG